jgi:hypothetical protein
VPEPHGLLLVAGLLPLAWMSVRNGKTHNQAA